MEKEQNIQEYDSLTGLRSFDSFRAELNRMVEGREDELERGEYALVYLDILRFKAINEIFGIDEGNRILKYIADTLIRVGGPSAICCRMISDRFIMFVHKSGEELQDAIDEYLQRLSDYPISYEIISNIGIYVTRRRVMSAESMIDRAVMAHSVIKGDYVHRFKYYESSQRDVMLSEQEIIGMMNVALEEEQFIVYYQPQYKHDDGSLVGAEALVRWNHPKRGLVPPGKFIPLFERNGFITKVDIYVFERVCAFLRQCIDTGLPTVPISVNLSRRDIFHEKLLDQLEEIRLSYEIPVDLIRIEITETAVMDGVNHVSQFISRLHEIGYIVEMDDFGSAYSSLNALKNIELDILKLDMRFLSDDGDKKYGSIILSSVVRMAKWLGFPVIAEGVEQMNQADYLCSIGCQYIQGYLYAKPMPQAEFQLVLERGNIKTTKSLNYSFNSMKAVDFWSADSMETLIFSEFVGAAAIVEAHEDEYELLRVNKKYLQELGDEYTEIDVLRRPFTDVFKGENVRNYREMMRKAIETGEEAECECWRHYGNDPSRNQCIRNTARVIGRCEDRYLLYVMIRNVTAEKKAMQEVIRRENIFRAASEQIDVYYWEYDVDTKEMYPCFRCIRDMGLPDVIENYPEPLFEMGVYPKEYADQYRAIMARVDAGEDGLELDMPLASKQGIFKFRYTTQYDESGKPIKAYGSAIKA